LQQQWPFWHQVWQAILTGSMCRWMGDVPLVCKKNCTLAEMKTFKISIFALSLCSFFLFSACDKEKRDEELKGCVYGKIKGFAAEYRIGCMSKAQFDRYLENPNYQINGNLVNKDIRFEKVKDCLECN
jgi:hypothetical protein